METTFKIRASSCSEIMGVKGLGKTGYSYLKSWLKEALFNRRPEIKSKYIDKGNISEEDGFTLLTLQKGLGMVYKNEQSFSNDFMTGTPDLIHNGIVYDNKCSWSLDTFPMFDKEIPNKDYYWQLQTYMELTGCNKSVLAYTLIDADITLIEQAVKWETNHEKIYKIICNMVYTRDAFNEAVNEFCHSAKSDYFIEIPEEKRIKCFEIERDDKAIQLIKDRVAESREYIKSLLNN